MEDSYLRRLYRILNLPTADLAHFKRKQLLDKKRKEKRKLTNYKRFKDWVSKKIRGKELTKSSIDGSFGFKSIQKKSVQFSNARFRD